MENQTIYAYMAGIVDGEGCITISKQIRLGRPSPAYRVMITVTNTNKSVVDLFKKYFDGIVTKRIDPRIIKKWADSYTWYCPEYSLKLFIKFIYPHLLIKKKQLGFIIDFLLIKKSFKRQSLGQGKGSAPLSKKEIIVREKIYLQIKKLNTKGIYSRSLKTKNNGNKI